MKKFIPSLILFSIFCFLFSIGAAQAALVPCGTSTTHPCTACDFGQLAINIVNFLLNIILPLAAVMIVIGGITIATAGDNPGKVSKGKEIITAAVVGILIALLSWIIIDTIIKVVAVGWSNLNIGPWNKINCNP